jgi:hypothetical protein
MLENDTLFGIPLILVGLGCFVLAAIFFFVWPRGAAKDYKVISWPHYILHYFHALAWILLGMAAVSSVRSQMGAAALGVIGLAVYAGFIGVLMRARRQPQ